VEPPYPWRTVARRSRYQWACSVCLESDDSDLGGYTQEAVDHARETGHRVSAILTQTIVVEGLKT
jgi:hypothetical protein